MDISYVIRWDEGKDSKTVAKEAVEELLIEKHMGEIPFDIIYNTYGAPGVRISDAVRFRNYIFPIFVSITYAGDRIIAIAALQENDKGILHMRGIGIDAVLDVEADDLLEVGKEGLETVFWPEEILTMYQGDHFQRREEIKIIFSGKEAAFKSLNNVYYGFQKQAPTAPKISFADFEIHHYGENQLMVIPRGESGEITKRSKVFVSGYYKTLSEMSLAVCMSFSDEKQKDDPLIQNSFIKDERKKNYVL